MFSDRIAISLCGLTLLLFFLSGLLGFLSNPFVIGTIVLIIVAVIANLFVVKKTPDDTES